jgi:hypothetical protein
MTPIGIVITVYRGGCQVVFGDQVCDLKLLGRHAEQGLALAVGDEISFDPEKEIVLERLPRRTRLLRLRRRSEQVIAANMDQLAVVASFLEPSFRPGAVDRFLLAAYAGGLEPILIVNKLDLLKGEPLPEEVRVYQRTLPVFSLCALTGKGLAPLREKLRGVRTVLRDATPPRGLSGSGWRVTPWWWIRRVCVRSGRARWTPTCSTKSIPTWPGSPPTVASGTVATTASPTVACAPRPSGGSYRPLASSASSGSSPRSTPSGGTRHKQDEPQEAARRRYHEDRWIA